MKQFFSFTWIAFLFLMVIGMTTPLPGQDFGMGDEKVITGVKTRTSQDKARPGDGLALAVEFQLAKKFHLYGPNVKNYDEALIPVSLDLELPKGIKKREIIFEKPSLKEDPTLGKKIPMYYGSLTVYVVFDLDEKVQAGKVEISGSLRYQACSDKACLPPANKKFSHTLEVLSDKGEVKVRKEGFEKNKKVAALLGWEVKKGEKTSDLKKGEDSTENKKKEDSSGKKETSQKADGKGDKEEKKKEDKESDPFATSDKRDQDKVIEEMKIFQSLRPIRPQDTFAIALRIKVNKPYHLYGPNVKEYEEVLNPVSLTVQIPQLEKVGIFYSPAPLKMDPSAGKKLPMYEGEFYVYIVLKAGEEVKKGDVQIRGTFHYQACDNEQCLFPTEKKFSHTVKIVDAGEAAKIQKEEIFKSQSQVAQALGWTESGGSEKGAGQDGKEKKKGEKSDFEEVLSKGILWAILMCFVWGVMSAFLPCVYPLIPVTISYFTAQSKGSTALRVTMGGLYMLGIALSLTVLSLVATLVLKVQAGSILANPYFVHGLFIFFFILSLSMFGLFELQLPSSITDRIQGSQKGGVLGAFFMGAVLGLVAAPCVAGPFAAVLAYAAATKNFFISFSSTFAYGLGLGFPFMFLAIFSGMTKAMPKAGGWMERIKYIMGFVMIAVGIYFEQNAAFIPEYVAYIGYGAIILLSAVYLGAFDTLEQDSSVKVRLGKGLGLVTAVLGAYFLLGGLYESEWVVEKTERTALTSPGEKNRALPTEVKWKKEAEYVQNPRETAKAKDKHVVVFFSATWCVYCKKMKKTVFKDPQVIQYMDKHFFPVYADVDRTKGAQKLKSELNIQALPGFAFYSKDGKYLGKTGKENTESFLKVLKNVVEESKVK